MEQESALPVVADDGQPIPDKPTLPQGVPDLRRAFAKCKGLAQHAMTESPAVLYMKAAIEKAGGVMPERFVDCRLLSTPTLGGYSPDEGKVVLNYQLNLSQSDVNRTVVHELIHAYDHTRVEMNYNDCRHIACTEIRAANLSTDCSFTNEMKRLNFGFAGQQKRCVKRRAGLSMMGHPACEGKVRNRLAANIDVLLLLTARGHSEIPKDFDKVIDGLFEVCYKDTAPFGDIPI